VLHLTGDGHAAWGFHFRFESDDPLLVDVVERCYRDLPTADGELYTLRAFRQPGDRDRYRVTLRSPTGDVEECGDGRARGAVLELLCWEVNRRALWSAAGDVVLHAAVLAGSAGAVALCGESHSGKSTLAAAAARRRWHHLSDDMGLVDVDRLTVTPYARPVMVRAGGRSHLGTLPPPPEAHLQFFPDDWFLPASELGAVVGSEPVPLIAIGFLEWGSVAAVTPLTPARTLHDLVLHSATVARQGVAGFARLEQLARSVPGYRVELGASDAVIDLVAALTRPAARE